LRRYYAALDSASALSLPPKMNRTKLSIAVILLFVAGTAVLLWPVTENAKTLSSMNGPNKPAPTLDLSAHADSVPRQPLDVLFIHHSCGGQLLASSGPDSGTNCIYVSHPNGGNLRARLEQNGYRIHEASYKSRIADKTDVFDWLPKFRTQMDDILVCDFQDNRYSDARRNQIVVFKSCFPNSDFKGEGQAPGNPAGPELTLWNAKATYTSLLAEFRKHPDVLFVCATAPPLAPKAAPQPLWKVLAKKALGRENGLVQSSKLAREFSNWLSSPDGWLKESQLNNVVVFNYYDILTDHGASDLCQYPTADGFDSHPSREGNEKAADAFVPFLNRAVRHAGLSQ
jgi:hypothetical protein